MLAPAARQRKRHVRERTAVFNDFEDRHRTLFESLSLAIVYQDSQGKILSANCAAQRILGMEAHQLIGQSFLNERWQVSGEDMLPYPPEERPVRKVLATGRPVHGAILRVVDTLDNSVRWYCVDALPRFRPGESKPFQVATTFLDITRERVALTALREREQQLKLALEDARDWIDRDPLTGLFSHRAFQKRIVEESERAPISGETSAIVIADLDNFRFFNDVYGHVVGDEILRQVAARLIACVRGCDYVARFGGDEFALLLVNTGNVTASSIEERIKNSVFDLTYTPANQHRAIPIALTVGATIVGASVLEWHDAINHATERLRWRKSGGDPEFQADLVRSVAHQAVAGFSMLDSLVAAVDNKDRYTRRHSEDVMTYSVMIARELGMDEATQHQIAIAALLHDVGKIGVPDAILRKPSQLSNEEFEAVKLHPELGAVIVSAVNGLESALDAVRHHHERWDGKGYPSGLKGEETPLVARLMAVADAFDAMTTDRPYRKAMEEPKALSILLEGAGTQWDPECVRAFERGLKLEAKAAR